MSVGQCRDGHDVATSSDLTPTGDVAPGELVVLADDQELGVPAPLDQHRRGIAVDDLERAPNVPQTMHRLQHRAERHAVPAVVVLGTGAGGGDLEERDPAAPLGGLLGRGLRHRVGGPVVDEADDYARRRPACPP